MTCVLQDVVQTTHTATVDGATAGECGGEEIARKLLFSMLHTLYKTIGAILIDDSRRNSWEISRCQGQA